jgi:hypothetical protein
VEKSAYTRRIRLPQLDTLKWRVDVTISTGSLLRVMKPVLMLQLTLTDGTTATFEVSQDRFHQLRSADWLSLSVFLGLFRASCIFFFLFECLPAFRSVSNSSGPILLFDTLLPSPT